MCNFFSIGLNFSQGRSYYISALLGLYVHEGQRLVDTSTAREEIPVFFDAEYVFALLNRVVLWKFSAEVKNDGRIINPQQKMTSEPAVPYVVPTFVLLI